MRARACYLLEGVRLEGTVRLSPLTLWPIALEAGYYGREGREIFNGALDEAGFVTDIPPWSWGVQVAPRHRMACAVIDPFPIEQAPDASTFANAAVGQLADLLALTHGGAPRVVASVSEISDEADAWRSLAIMVGSGAWSGSMLAKLAPDEEPVEAIDLEHLWVSGNPHARNALWLSLHRDVTGVARRDVRIFRTCSLLETVAREVVSGSAAVHDSARQSPPRLRRRTGHELAHPRRDLPTGGRKPAGPVSSAGEPRSGAPPDSARNERASGARRSRELAWLYA